MFTIHPSRELQALFGDKPYQGADPAKAKLVFLGLDANYSASIDREPIYPQLVAYHSDGPGFWRTHGVHHPFLLSSYRGAGRKYHRNFSQIGFSANDADSISFVELLPVPTTGRSQIMTSDLDGRYIRHLRGILFSSGPKKVFMSPSVIRLMNQAGVFPALKQRSTPLDGELPIYLQSGGVTVYKHFHFSVYGKFEQQRISEAKKIRALGLQV